MVTRFLTLGTIVWLSVSVPTSARLDAAAPRLRSTNAPSTSTLEQRTLLNRYCVSCHNQRLKTGGLALDTLDVAEVGRHPEVWEKVVRKLRAGVMPPAGRPRPDKTTYDALASWFETELDRAAAGNPNPGRTPAFHRLNRTEYQHVIRDLLALEIDVASLLPADDSSYGFDNIGDILGVTPALVEGYLEAARKVSQEAVGDPAIGQETQVYSLAPDLTQNARLEDLPFGTRGGTLVRHYFPVDGEYVIAVRLLRNFLGGIMGLAETHQLELTLDGERVQIFSVGGRKPREEGENAAQEPRNSELPADAGLNVRVAVKAGSRPIG